MWYAGGVVLLGAALLKNLPKAHSCAYPCVPGSEDIMKPKEHGTSHVPVQNNLRWGCDGETADRICNYNRHYAEFAGYWEKTTFKQEIQGKSQEMFYDSNTGKLLFHGPVDRTWDAWMKESSNHGWPRYVLIDGHVVVAFSQFIFLTYCFVLVSVIRK
jgi:hypothetical protein